MHCGLGFRVKEFRVTVAGFVEVVTLKPKPSTRYVNTVNINLEETHTN
jgi:hypothetical protein